MESDLSVVEASSGKAKVKLSIAKEKAQQPPPTDDDASDEEAKAS